MGFLERITRNDTADRSHNTPAERHYTPQRSASTDNQYSSRGIPPIANPRLPSGRAAILIACTKTKRAYWVVFKQAPASPHGWVWERNLPALPNRTNGSHASRVNATHFSSGAEVDLSMGGRDWGDWSCPGCGQPQIPTGSKDFLHCHICRCGMECCLGSGADGTNESTCPNCKRAIRERSRIRRSLPNTRYGSKSPDAVTEMPASNRRQIEDG